ncbi:MAG: glycosyl transferase [Sphingobacteriales bacterium]|nr:glycosyl transferase [Sphingobacteriales bacterium]
MKILFAIQGTGNGHISRAREIVPLLKEHGHVDILVSGTQADLTLNEPLAHKFHGFSFIFGKRGGVNHWQTYRTMNLLQLWKDARSLPLKKYDIIINDFEPVSSWACKIAGKPIIALSHQSSFLSKKTPRPPGNYHWHELIFKHYAPTTFKIGLHFEKYDDFIHTPIIRKEIREQLTSNLGHITVYLPAYSDIYLTYYLKMVTDVKWEVFSKHTKSTYQDGNVYVQPINHLEYNKSLANSSGLLTGAGFEGPAEALYMGKKVLVIPMKYQYEQQCNAESLREIGVQIVKSIDKDFVMVLKQWLFDSKVVKVNFPNETAAIIQNLITRFS